MSSAVQKSARRWMSRSWRFLRSRFGESAFGNLAFSKQIIRSESAPRTVEDEFAFRPLPSANRLGMNAEKKCDVPGKLDEGNWLSTCLTSFDAATGIRVRFA